MPSHEPEREQPCTDSQLSDPCSEQDDTVPWHDLGSDTLLPPTPLPLTPLPLVPLAPTLGLPPLLPAPPEPPGAGAESAWIGQSNAIVALARPRDPSGNVASADVAVARRLRHATCPVAQCSERVVTTTLQLLLTAGAAAVSAAAV